MKKTLVIFAVITFCVCMLVGCKRLDVFFEPTLEEMSEADETVEQTETPYLKEFTQFFVERDFEIYNDYISFTIETDDYAFMINLLDCYEHYTATPGNTDMPRIEFIVCREYRFARVEGAGKEMLFPGDEWFVGKTRFEMLTEIEPGFFKYQCVTFRDHTFINDNFFTNNPESAHESTDLLLRSVGWL